jgi:hypothetical protein
MSVRLPLAPLPPKPRFRTPCNGCGLCCHIELCEVGLAAFPSAQAPCPAMVFTAGRVWCGFVLAEEYSGLDKLIARGLGIGKGCSMPDENIPTT